MGEEVFPWLKSLPLAPEYHPTLTEFQDPISYIFKIEEEASKYGICKIIPPVSPSPKKTIIANLNRSLSSQNPDSSPTFTTRVQQIGVCPRKPKSPVQKSVWESGKYYTVAQFEAKAKNFEKNYLKKGSNPKRGLTALDAETLYWKAHMDKSFTIEYANDMPGSAFDQTVGGDDEGLKQRRMEIGDVMTVGETRWNMQGASRAKGSLLRFMKEELPGVTSPMVYLSMLFSWFAWHVEDHDFHSLNYMHMGASKTWYGVPKDAAVAFEDVVRAHGYGGQISPLVTFANLAQKTTIMSPEVLLKAGVPCCRLVQNAGEFVVTFPRAYHSGFSHGFNCAEATNIATPGWLIVARDATIRRASINYVPMVSHTRLHYDLALSLIANMPTGINREPRSSRLKVKLKAEGETLVKRLFLEDVMQNNELLYELGEGSPVVVLSEEALDGWISSDSCYRTRCNQNDKSLSSRRRRCSSSGGDASPRQNTGIENDETRKPDPASVFSCVACGVLCYSCVAIVKPSMAAARYLMTASDLVTATDYAKVVDLGSYSGRDRLFDVPIKSEDDKSGIDSVLGQQEVDSALKLLALAYGDCSDSDEGDDFVHSKSNKYFMESNCSMDRFKYQTEAPHTDGKVSSLINPANNEDSSRMHVFCLHHAREVEQRLRPHGGVHMLLLCHQDHPKIDDTARELAEELGNDRIWTDLGYREIAENDKAKIRSALDNDETAHDNHDWVVRLGFDIYYSARLSRSPIYTKQMPYNSVIDNAIGHVSPSTDSTKSKASGKQKKIVMAGNWCGKVWMSNQVHPFLVVRDLEEHDENETSRSVLTSMADVKPETETKSENSKKRKMTVKVKSPPSPSPSPSPQPPSPPVPVDGGTRRKHRMNLRNNQIRKKTLPNLNEKPIEMETDSDDDYRPTRRTKRRIIRRKKAKKAIATMEESEDEGKFGCDIKGCNMSFDNKRDLVVHTRNVCMEEGCGKEFLTHKYLKEHRRVHTNNRRFKCKWAGCPKAFNWAWSLTEHVRTHTQDRPYKCTEEGCGKTFRFVSDSSRHKRKTGHLVKK